MRVREQRGGGGENRRCGRGVKGGSRAVEESDQMCIQPDSCYIRSWPIPTGRPTNAASILNGVASRGVPIALCRPARSVPIPAGFVPEV